MNTFVSDTEKYKDKNLPIEERVWDLLNRMTPEEKIRQINMYPWMYEDWAEAATPILSPDGEFNESYLNRIISGNAPGMIRGIDKVKPQNSKIANKLQKYAVRKTRLGIPFLFICEGPHGYVGTGGTIFPQNIALAGTFNTELLRKMGEITAREARSVGINVVKGPILDVVRDPRWGRIEETFGEDTYLVGKLGLEVVKGMQANLDSDFSVLSMLKHFVAYGMTEGGHNCSPACIGERELREIVFPPFDEAIKKGGALAIMSAYNEIDGIPCNSNGWLLNDILRNEMGFTGFVQSDAGAIKLIFENHGADSDEDAVKQSIEAGMDIQNYDYNCSSYELMVSNLIKKGKISMNSLDRAVTSLLRVKFKLGLFDNPYISEESAATIIGCIEHQKAALDSARQSVCLLKNEENLLPLKKNMKSIAVIGPNADRKVFGSYIGYSDWDVQLSGETVLSNVRKIVSPDTKILYAKGCELIDKAEKANMVLSAHAFMLDHISQSLYEDQEKDIEIKKACDIARKADAAIVVLGEAPWITSSEGMDRADIGLTGNQLTLIKKVYETGTPVVAVLLNGRPIAIPWIAENIPAIVEGWYPGQTGGKAIAEVLFGDYNPAGRLPISFPRGSAQLPVYYNCKQNARRKYLDSDPNPLYKFGHGLSYTNFGYYNLDICFGDNSKPLEIAVKIQVANEGPYDGDEVVQLYLTDLIASITPRVKMLKGFQRVHLKNGERKTLTFILGENDLSIIDRNMEKTLEPGEFEIAVGGDSENCIKGKFILSATKISGNN